jgi:hypothetical protein
VICERRIDTRTGLVWRDDVWHERRLIRRASRDVSPDRLNSSTASCSDNGGNSNRDDLEGSLGSRWNPFARISLESDTSI